MTASRSLRAETESPDATHIGTYALAGAVPREAKAVPVVLKVELLSCAEPGALLAHWLMPQARNGTDETVMSTSE
jgi:hypothetical protein